MRGAGNSLAGGRRGARRSRPAGASGGRLSPRRWEQGLAAPRDAECVPLALRAQEPCPGPPGGGFLHRGVDDPKELWGGRGSHGSLGGPGRSSVPCGWSGGGRGASSRAGSPGAGLGALRPASLGSGVRKAPAGTRTASGASANSRGRRSPAGEAAESAAGRTLGLNFWPGGPGRRWGSPGPEFAPSPPPGGLSRCLGRLSEAKVAASSQGRASPCAHPFRAWAAGPSPSPSGDTGTQSCPRVAPGSGVSRGVGVFPGCPELCPTTPVRRVQRGGEKLLGDKLISPSFL